MIPIVKHNEPRRLLEFHKCKDASYASMPGDVKALVKRSLAEEQGFLCAYCMRRLPREGTDDEGGSGITIEHWIPQNPQDGTVRHDPLDYKNMLAVCDGNRGNPHDELTCDASKGNAAISVNPLRPDTLLSIQYGSDGEISSTNREINHDLTVTLNLNCEAVSLPDNRKSAMQALQRKIMKEYQGRTVPRKKLQQYLDYYES